MFGGFYCLSWGRRGRTCGRDSHIQGELFPLLSSQGTCGAGMQQKPLLDLFSLLWMEGLSEAVPSLLQTVPQAVSPGASAEPCWGSCSPTAPLPHSVQLVLTAAPQKPGSPSLSALPCPGSATCNPSLPLGLPGSREASSLSASWQSLCMAASARPSILGMWGV